MNSFEMLNSIDVSGRIEKKGSLSYLSWAWAWAELKKRFPASFYTVYESANGLFYHTDGHTCWVKTGVTLVDGNTHNEAIEYLPVMDSRNKSIPTNAVTSFDVNKAIQRSLTKAIARHGLGLYIYAGEDLPEDANVRQAPEQPQKLPPVPDPVQPIPCDNCGEMIGNVTFKDRVYSPDKWCVSTTRASNMNLCPSCFEEWKKLTAPEDANGSR